MIVENESTAAPSADTWNSVRHSPLSSVAGEVIRKERLAPGQIKAAESWQNGAVLAPIASARINSASASRLTVLL